MPTPIRCLDGRSRGIRPIHPFVRQELRDAQATLRSLSRAIDANIHLANDADMEIMRRALQEETGKMMCLRRDYKGGRNGSYRSPLLPLTTIHEPGSVWALYTLTCLPLY